MLTATLENVLNRGLPRSPRAQQLCAELAGRSVAIEVRDITRLRVESNGSTLRITRGAPRRVPSRAAGASRDSLHSVPVAAGASGDSLHSAPVAGEADAEIVGGPIGLAALGGTAPDAVLQRGEVQIRGDAELAQKFRELVLLLKPDLEEELSLVVSDVPAHQIGRFARMAFGWTRRAAQTTAQNVAEYLAHERRHLVPRSEGEQFLRGVDTLREDVDRLDARVELLAKQRGLQ